ncbi:MAG: hypothetical protein K5Q68_22090 [Roseococcus sp.]|nr:hypothetical protein [Roseococcus sp.]
MKIHQDIKRGPIVAPPPRLLRNLPGVSDHAQLRTHERLPCAPTRAQWLQLVLDILDRRAALLSVDTRTRDEREHWLCLVAGQPMRVVWKPSVAMVITVMPLRAKPLSHRPLIIDASKRGHTKPEPSREPRGGRLPDAAE